MCKFQIEQVYNKSENLVIRKQIKKIPTGSSIFVKWYNVKTHTIQYTPGILIAKRGKGSSSHILIRRRVTKEVITLIFYIYSKTLLGIGLVKEEFNNLNAKKYNLLLRPIRWKYL